MRSLVTTVLKSILTIILANILVMFGLVGPSYGVEEETSGPIGADVKFLDRYPHLRDNLYVEPESKFHLGMSVGVLGIVASNMYFSANLFQIHYISSNWDNEIFSVAYGTTSTQSSQFQSNRFVFRTVPKYKWNQFVSIGPLVGYEFVSFPNVYSSLYKDGKQTAYEPFSTGGVIYGIGATENWKLEGGTNLRITEVFYQETYSVVTAGRGWSYLFKDTALNLGASPLKGGTLFAVEIGFIY